MPYGDLAEQAVQRFGSYEDLARHRCTIEEREEYETHLELGVVVYAGVDYQRILEQAQQEADVVLWDGGNNDTPFFRPDLWITITDPLRAGHELRYHPGEVNLRGADLVVINKVNAASVVDVARVEQSVAVANPGATLVKCDSRLVVEDRRGRRGEARADHR